jgi:pyridoxine 5-phosphate synthase
MNMRLYVNIDHVATVRQARKTDEPDPMRAAVLVEMAGADGVTVHLREDRRHIQDRDVALLMQTLRTGLNLELAASGEIVDLACAWVPMQATLVPEKRQEITTEGGLDLSTEERRAAIGSALRRLGEAGVRTSLFIGPEEDAIRAAVDLGADAVELHTGEYANTRGEERREQVARVNAGASLARKLNLDVHAGHGLTYENVTPIAAIPEIEELNIGHSIVSRAIFTGLEAAVREMATLIRRARAPR